MKTGNRGRTSGPFWNMCGLASLLMGTVVLLQGCAADQVFEQPPVEIRDSLPPYKLAHFSDNFDSFREDLWDKIGLLFQESQMENYQSGTIRIEKGELVIETQMGSFSKGGLASKYSLRGDFDIQVDCRFDFQKEFLNFDQILAFNILEENPETGKPHRLISTGLIKLGENPKGGIYSVYRDILDVPLMVLGRSWAPMGNFKGSLRIIRKDRQVRTYYRKKGDNRWIKTGVLVSTGNDAVVGFDVQNFSPNRAGIIATKPVIGRLESFHIHAAQGIVEEEI